MCGIFGIYSSGKHQDCEVLDRTLASALSRLRHRGPNGSGVISIPIVSGPDGHPFNLSLGHTRLSVIDLSEDGRQPMSSSSGRFTVVFNGEIYNYKELRQKLRALGCVFSTLTDTEVLLAAWETWGRSCLNMFVGMFSFVIFDRQRLILTCVRDPFGIKPFFYSNKGGQFYFASEIPALIELLPERPSLNWQQSYNYLVHGDYDSSTFTFYNEIFHLAPGNTLEIDLRASKILVPEVWYKPNAELRENWTYSSAVEAVREEFLHSIRLHMRSDVQIGAALSGGIDSSAVVSAMRYLEPDLPIHTFSFVASDPSMSEKSWIGKINNQNNGIPHHVSINEGDLGKDLDDLIISQGEPFGSTSIYAQYRVFQSARENGVVVTLDGQGADEMLAGYIGYPGQRLRSMLEGSSPIQALEFLNNWSKWPGRSRMLGMKHLVSECTNGRIYEILRFLDGKPTNPSWVKQGALNELGIVPIKPRFRADTNTKGRRVIDELILSLTKRGLPGLLRHGDRNSMKFSIESRVPFLTKGLVDLLLSMPEDYLISKAGETKHIFRTAMKGIVCDDVLKRRDKIGFETPERIWLSGIRHSMIDCLSENLNIPFWDQQNATLELKAMLDGHKPFSWQAWRWVNFAKWLQLFNVKH
jgi:asparagine synthase (glutamine-hydrolysing)